LEYDSVSRKRSVQPKVEMEAGFFSKGLYTVAEASRLTGVPSDTFRRWAFGYARRRHNERVDYSPLNDPEIGQIEGHYVVGFRDLLEARIVQAFRGAGVSWHVIRTAAKNARSSDRISHPFLSEKFRTDGRTIFLETIKETGACGLLDLAKNQHAFHAVIAPSLFKQIEFDAHDNAIRWYPLWPRKAILVDPQRSFGRPLSANVPAETLAAAAMAENSIDSAARWFGVSPESVRAAVEWQERLVS
jgi:DNA-binding transcriptional MerR regulator